MTTSATSGPRPLWRRLVFPAVTVLGLILVAPILTNVYSSLDSIADLGVGWLLAMTLASSIQLIAFWELHRIVLRTDKWFDVAASHLAGNAASHIVPGGSAVGAGIEARMLTISGFSLTRTGTSLGAITILSSIANYVILPLVVLVASASGSSIDPRLTSALWVGAVVLAAALVIGITVSLREAPWRQLSRLLAWVYRRLHRKVDPVELEHRLMTERDFIRDALRGKAVIASLSIVGSSLGDFAVLYFALRAVGAHVNPAAALAAFIVSNVAGLIPITPGGLGFVEAGMSGVLVVAGATTSEALLAVAAYRLFATWLPCAAGGVAYVWFKRRHREAVPSLHAADVYSRRRGVPGEDPGVPRRAPSK